MDSEQRTLTANFTANASGFAAGTNETIQKLRDLNTQVVENKQKIKDVNAEMRKYQQELSKLKSSTNNGADATSAERKRMQELTDAISRCRTNLGTLAAAQQRLQSDVRNVNRELDEQRETAQEVSSAYISMGDIIKANLGSEAIMGAINVLSNDLRQLAIYCYGVGTEFEAAMSQVEAISGAYGENLEALTKKAKDLGAATKFSATEVAQAMNYMAMADWDAEQMLAGIDGVIRLAAASGGDLAETSDIITDALTAFGMKAEDVGHFADVLAAASANANTNVSMLGESFKYVAPLAGTMGYSIDETAEMLGIMANSGIKASTAGTSMRTMLTNLAQGVEIEAAAFGKMEINAANADGSMKSLNEVLGELRSAFSLMTDEEKTNNAAIIAGDKALSGFLSLVNAGEADINKLRSAIENCDGAAEKMAETMQNNVAGKATILKSAIEGLGIAIYEKFSRAIGDSLDNVTEKIDNLNNSVVNGELGNSLDGLAESAGNAAEELIDFAGEVLPGFIGATTNVLKFLTDFRVEIQAVLTAIIAYKAAMKAKDIFTSFVGSIKSIISAFQGLKTATTAATTAQNAHNAAVSSNPYAIAAAAIGLLAGGLTELKSHLDDCNEKTREYMENVEELKQISEEYHDKAAEMGDIAREYDEITKSTDDTATKTARLKDLQDRLINEFGAEADGIDLVTDAFSNQAKVLEILNAKREEYDKISKDTAQEALDKLKNAESEKTAINVGNVFSGIDYSGLSTIDMGSTIGASAAQGALSTALKGPFSFLDDRMIYLSGTFEERLADLKEFKTKLAREGKSATDTYKQIIALIDQMEQDIADKEKYQGILENYSQGNFDNDGDIPKPALSGVAANEQAKAERRKAEARAAYDAEKKDLDAALAAQEISQENYYKQLEKLRNKYFDQNGEDWNRVTKQIVGSAESAADKIGSAVDKTSDKIKGVFSDIRNEFQGLLDGIDKELEKHNRDKEDEEYQSKIDSITKRLQYEKLDIYTRKSLEKELSDLYENWDEAKYRRSKNDQKDIIQAASQQASTLMNSASDITKLTQTQWNNIISAFKDAAPYINSSDFTSETAQNVYNIVINGLNKTEQQIEDEIMRKISSGVV